MRTVVLYFLLANRTPVGWDDQSFKQTYPTRFARLFIHSRRSSFTDKGLDIVAIAQTVSNNQNTIMGLASDMSSLEERIKNLSAHYR